MNQSSPDPYYEFNRLKQELQRVSDAISPLSMRSQQERIEMLKDWREHVYSLLYHDRSSPQHENSTNLFAEEIDRNMQFLRNKGFDVQGQRQELTRFISERIKPFQIQIQKIIIDLQQEAGESDSLMPVEPVEVAYEDSKSDESIIQDFGRRERYRQRYEAWQAHHIPIFDYHQELLRLDRNLTDIRETVEGRTGQQDITPTPPASDTPNPPVIAPGFDTYIVEEHRAELTHHLTQKYRDKTPRFYVPMLYALENLGYLTERINKYDLTALHKSLAVTLGSIGEYSGFHTAIKLHDPQTIQPAKQQKIRGIQIEIDNVLKQG